MVKKRIVVECYASVFNHNKREVIAQVKEAVKVNDYNFDVKAYSKLILKGTVSFTKAMMISKRLIKFINPDTKREYSLMKLIDGTNKVYVICNWCCVKRNPYLLLNYGKPCFKKEGKGRLNWRLGIKFCKTKKRWKQLKLYSKYAVFVDRDTGHMVTKEEIKDAIKKIKSEDKFAKMQSKHLFDSCLR